MAAQRETGPGRHPAPVPRDMPDQQAGAGEDKWEVTPEEGPGPEEDATTAADAPDADEPSA